MSKKKEYRIKLAHFNIILAVSIVVIIAVALGISGVVINKIKEKDAPAETTTQNVVSNPTTTTTEPESTEETDEPVLTAKDYYELANAKYDKGEYKDALNYSYNFLDMEADVTQKEEILFKIADVYVADNNLRAAYYLLEDCGIEGLVERYCSEKVDLKKSLTRYTDPTDKNYIYMGYYPQTGYSATEVPEYVTNAVFDTNGFARIYGVEYTRINNGETYDYFVSEPVRWWIIDSSLWSYTVISDKLIDCKPFHNALTSVTWDVSALKMWTNGEFYNKCFNDKEKSFITEHTTPASWNYYYQFKSGSSTKDRVGVIPAAALSDRTHIFMDHDSDESKLLRKALVTDYSAALGAYVDENGYGKWWTATSANKENWYTVTVTHEGIILVVSGGDAVNKTDICVRPYMTIKK